MPQIAGHRRVTARLCARSLTALVGSYAAASGLAALFARLAPIARVEATLWAMIASFAVFAAFGLWAFHEPRLGRVAAVIWGTAAASIALVLALGVRP